MEGVPNSGCCFGIENKLLVACPKEAETCGFPFSDYEPFLYGLLSDSREIFDWLSHAELKEKDDVKSPHLRWYQFQLVLRRDDDALSETIALVAKKGRKHDKALAVWRWYSPDS